MSDSDVSQTTTKLKIFALVADGYRAVFGNLSTMVRILWLPVMLMGIVNYRFQSQNFQDFTAVMNSESDPAALQAQLDAAFDPMFFIYMLVSWVVMCAVFVSLHRFVLLGEKPPSLGFTVRKREWRYLGYVITIAAIATLVMIVAMTVLLLMEALLGGAGGMVSILVFFGFIALTVFVVMVYLRLGFALPAIALDQEGGLRRRLNAAWTLAKGNTFRMFAALVVAQLPFMVIFGIWSYQFMQSAAELMATSAPLESSMLLSLVIFGVFSWLSYAVMIAMYSIAYLSLETGTTEQQVET